MIPVYEPLFSDQEPANVVDCLSTGWISSRGEYINKFEKACANLLQVEHCLSVSNGTVSIMLILAALDFPRDTQILVPSLTYAATVSQPIWLGLRPVLFDSDDNYQPSLASLKKAKMEYPDAKAVILPELYGSAPDLEQFRSFCNSAELILIEDSAEVFGSTCSGKMLGTFGLAGSFSFFGNKTITTGEGGLVVTNNKVLADKMNLLKNQFHIGNFVHHGPGFNFRMTNIQAAIGCGQLSHYSSIVQRKKEIANFYRQNVPSRFTAIAPASNIDSTEWMPLFVLPEDLSYIDFHNHMKANGIETRPCFTPIHMMPGWENKYDRVANLSTSEKIAYKGFNLPSSPKLKDSDLEFIVSKLAGV